VISLVAAAVIGVVVYLISGVWFLALGIGAGSLLLRSPILNYMRRQRITRLEEQLPGALDLLTSYTRAGLSLTQALEELANNTSPPISQELSLIVQEIKVGAEVGKAIESARLRLGSRTFGLAATALQVSREKGGDLTEALERMSAALKEIWRLEQKLITASTEARKATWIISGAPLVIGAMVLTFQPDMAYALVESLWGILFLVLSGAIYGFGLWWLLRSLKVVV
jgi:tight adherence protein B